MVNWGCLSITFAAEPSPYERLHNDKLTEKLAEMKMPELLEELLGKQVRRQLEEALGTTDQEKRDRLLQEVSALQRRLIKATAELQDTEGVLRHFRFRLDLVITEGITKVDPYAERLLYFLGTEKDRAAVAKYTEGALGPLNALQTDLERTHGQWARDQDRMITGVLWRLEALMEEARYRGAWVRFYRGVVLAKDSQERHLLLPQAIDDVKEFANAEDNDSGVKFTSLLLSGMAARELGLWEQAASYLKRAGDPQARSTTQLKARFEAVRISIDQGRFDEADNRIQQFVEEGSRLPELPKVALEMQSALLRFKVKMERAEAQKAGDHKLYEKLRGEAGRELVDFVEKYPMYREAFWDRIAPLFEEADPDSLDPPMQLALGVKEFSKQTGEGYNKAEKLFRAVANSAKAPDSSKASALWYLGLIKNAQRKNLEAARFFRELAENYAKDPKAKESALNSVKSFQGILIERKVTADKLGMDFVREYARSLRVLVDGWGKDDRKIRTYNYELGVMLEALGQNREAVEALKQIPEESELSMPARYRILEVTVNDLLDATTMQASLRGRLAHSLIGDLTRYMERARAYAGTVSDKERAEQALAWGAECGMLIAQLHKDVLNDPAEAMQRAKELANDPTWKQVPAVARRSQQFVVGVLLEAGQPEKVIPDLIALTRDDPGGAEKLLVQAVGQIGERIERLMYAADPAAKQQLEGLRAAYKIFAEELYKFVERSGGVPEQQKAPFKQALAHAYEFGTKQEAEKSLELYLQLHDQNRTDANIVRGLARAYRVLGQPQKAMPYYNRLISGLPEKSPHWWRAQFERLEYALDIYAGNETELNKIPIQIRMLRDKDRDMGGYWQQFNKVEARAKEITGSASPAGAASRGSGF
ncbi:MAG: hypothetical protein AMJ81_01130 [Phycisphaerae bacterium SM23_33]|nr:MAG: hypothetical protein AMJ81_01130 [Phycisphaerae bacterium SM23_33]